MSTVTVSQVPNIQIEVGANQVSINIITASPVSINLAS